MGPHDAVSAAVAAEIDQDGASEAFALIEDGPPTVKVRPRLRLADPVSAPAAEPARSHDTAAFSAWSTVSKS